MHRQLIHQPYAFRVAAHTGHMIRNIDDMTYDFFDFLNPPFFIHYIVWFAKKYHIRTLSGQIVIFAAHVFISAMIPCFQHLICIDGNLTVLKSGIYNRNLIVMTKQTVIYTLKTGTPQMILAHDHNRPSARRMRQLFDIPSQNHLCKTFVSHDLLHLRQVTDQRLIAVFDFPFSAFLFHNQVLYPFIHIRKNLFPICFFLPIPFLIRMPFQISVRHAQQSCICQRIQPQPSLFQLLHPAFQILPQYCLRILLMAGRMRTDVCANKRHFTKSKDLPDLKRQIFFQIQISKRR